MKPVYKIEANGSDITANLKGRLISATLTDNEGMKSDTFEMVLDDRDIRDCAAAGKCRN